MIINEKEVSGVVKKYYDLLIKSGVLSSAEEVLIEPYNKDYDESNFTVLQQGAILFDFKKYNTKVQKIITCSDILYDKLKKVHDKVYLLEFPIEDEYKKINRFIYRENAIYYHGRILPEKVLLEDLRKLLDSKIRVVLRGPICKEYWGNKDLEAEKFVDYKKQILELVEEYDNFTVLPETKDKNVIIKDLNKYRYYFTLSTGEAFNLALQEAIACGTIPIVRDMKLYLWADGLYIGFNSVEEMMYKYDKENVNNRYHIIESEYFSSFISSEIKKRCSFEAIKLKFSNQLSNNIS